MIPTRGPRNTSDVTRQHTCPLSMVRGASAGASWSRARQNVERVLSIGGRARAGADGPTAQRSSHGHRRGRPRRGRRSPLPGPPAARAVPGHFLDRAGRLDGGRRRAGRRDAMGRRPVRGQSRGGAAVGVQRRHRDHCRHHGGDRDAHVRRRRLLDEPGRPPARQQPALPARAAHVRALCHHADRAGRLPGHVRVLPAAACPTRWSARRDRGCSRRSTSTAWSGWPRRTLRHPAGTARRRLSAGRPPGRPASGRWCARCTWSGSGRCTRRCRSRGGRRWRGCDLPWRRRWPGRRPASGRRTASPTRWA